MKTIKSIIVIILIGIVSVVQAQKVYKVSDVVNGKTILEYAQKIDVDAFLQTKTIYKAGMTEATFVNELLNKFPKGAESLKSVTTPYIKYVYSIHKKGLTEDQIKGKTTGVEFAKVLTDLSTWNTNNPGQIPEMLRFNWEKFLNFVVQLIEIILDIFF